MKALTIVLALLLFPSLAVAQKVQYLPDDVGVNGTDFSNCTSTFSGGVYYITCSGNLILPNGNNNEVELTATPIDLTVSGDLTLGGTDINPSGSENDLTITVSGNLNPGNNGNIINANMTISGSINSGNNTSINGGLTISGNVNLGNNSSIDGNVEVTGDLNTGSNVSINGNVDAGGNINVGQNNDINGDLSGSTININGSNSTITGNVEATEDLNNNGTIVGNVNVSGDLNNNGTIEGGYINATCTEDNSCGGDIDVEQVCNTDDIDDNTSECAGGTGDTDIHSFLLTHSGTALTCENYSVTVTACADAACNQTTAGSGEVVVDINGNTGTADFNSTDTAVAELAVPTSGTYTLSVSSVTGFAPANGAQYDPSNGVTAVDTALRFSGEQTQLSGSDFTLGLEAIRTDTSTGACVAAFDTGKNVDFSLSCEDPASCLEPIVINSTNVTTGTSVNVDFSAGSATLQMNYADVGRIRLSASAQGQTTAFLQGTSNPFVVKPWGVGFTITGGLAANEAGNAASYPEDSVFEYAGADFNVELEPLNDGGGVPPNFGNEGEQLVLTGHNLLAPTSGTPSQGNLSVNGTTVSFSEVGVIELIGGLQDGDYLGAGAIPNNNSQPVGRFVPHRFVQTNGELLGACGNGAFNYMGQAQSFVANLMAVNSDPSPSITQNYYGDFANGEPEFYAYTDSDPNTAVALPRLTALQGHLAWQNGQSVWLDSLGGIPTNPSITLQRDSNPDGHYPNYSLTWQIDDGERDAGGTPRYLTTIENSDFPGIESSALLDSIALYYGRLVLENTYGSAAEQLPVFATIEYYRDDGTQPRFVRNSADSCTALRADQLDDDLSTSDVEATRLPATDSTEQLVTAGRLFDHDRSLSSQLGWEQPTETPGTFQFQLLLADPNNDLDYLQFDWDDDGSFDDNPEATGTFGIFRHSDRQIYWREVGW